MLLKLNFCFYSTRVHKFNFPEQMCLITRHSCTHSVVCDTLPEQSKNIWTRSAAALMEAAHLRPAPPSSGASYWLLSAATLARGQPDWSALTLLPLTDSRGAPGSSQRQRTLFECWTWRLLNIDPLRCRQWEAHRTVEERLTV